MQPSAARLISLLLNLAEQSVKDWFEKLIATVMKDLVRSICALLISFFVIWAFANHFYEYFSPLTLITYVLLCIRGLPKIVDDPKRSAIWAVGCIVASVATQILLEQFIPSISFRDVASIVSLSAIGYVVIALYMKANQLKST